MLNFLIQPLTSGLFRLNRFSLALLVIGSLSLLSTDYLNSQCLTRQVSLVAGTGEAGFIDGPGINAQFNSPFGIVLDPAGNLYVADSRNHRIRKITPAGIVSTFAGTGVPGFVDGPGINAQFNSPKGIEIDNLGNLFVTDTGNHSVRKITPAGVVSTIAGTGGSGFANGPGISSMFSSPFGIQIDGAGDLYIADNGNHRIRKITSAGIVSTAAGTGVSGYMEGPVATAQLRGPTDVRVNSSGELFIVDQGNNRIRKLNSAGNISTFAGSGVNGTVDGIGVAAQFALPYRIESDADGNLYVSDISGQLRKINPSGVVTTLTNTITTGFSLGPIETAQIFIRDLTIDNNTGDFYTVGGNRVLKISDCPSTDAVPTMGEWGLIILGLMLLIIGVVSMKSRELMLKQAGVVRANL